MARKQQVDLLQWAKRKLQVDLLQWAKRKLQVDLLQWAKRKLPILLSVYFKVTQFFTQTHDAVGNYLCITVMQSGAVVYLIKMNNSTSKTNSPQVLY